MYSLTRPTTTQVQQYLEQQSKQPFSCPDAGASAQIWSNSDHHLDRHYIIDHNRVLLGSGAKIFEQAKAAVSRWEMFGLDWVELMWPETPIQVGSTVGIMVQQLGIWSLNPCRIIYILEENGSTEKFGLAVGTLPDHGLCGEERFVVEWCRSNDTVWYDLLAFSRPHQWLTILGYWYVRRLQKRFGAGSLQAMERAVSKFIDLE